MFQQFKHKTPIQVRFKDIDAFRHVNNANHFTYLEIARANYINELFDKEIDWIEKGLILAKANVDYKLPILLSDNIDVYTRCSRIGNKSFDLSYLIVKTDNQQEIIMSEAITVLVAYNCKKAASILIPQEWIKRMNEYEKQTF